MKNDLLHDLNNQGFVEVHFKTKKNTTRIMYCTRHLKSIPEGCKAGILDPKLNAPGVIAVYDWGNLGWRAFREDSVIEWSAYDC